MTGWQGFAFIMFGLIFGALLGAFIGPRLVHRRWLIVWVVLVAPFYFGFEQLALGQWEPW